MVKIGCFGRIQWLILSCSALNFGLRLKILALVRVEDLVLWPQVFIRTLWAHLSSMRKKSSNILWRGLSVTIVPSSLFHYSGLFSSLDLIPWVTSSLVGSMIYSTCTLSAPSLWRRSLTAQAGAEQGKSWNFKAVFSVYSALIHSPTLVFFLFGLCASCPRAYLI
jgi:hypothetical protein